MSETEIRLQAADVFFTRSESWLGGLVRFFTRSLGERRTRVNHVGVVVKGGPLSEAVVIEALERVREHRLADKYGGRADTKVAVFRPLRITTSEQSDVVRTAQHYRGKRYGFLKLLAHLADWVLQGLYVFRRLARQSRYPICSWVVAFAFEEIGRRFGVAPEGASPDDIWDYMTAHPDEYLRVRRLTPLGGAEPAPVAARP